VSTALLFIIAPYQKYMRIYIFFVLLFFSSNLRAQQVQCLGVENHRGFFYQLAPPGKIMFTRGGNVTAGEYFFVSTWQLSWDGVAKVLQKRYGSAASNSIHAVEPDSAKFICRPMLLSDSAYQLIGKDCGVEIGKAITIDLFDSTTRAWKTRYGGRRIWSTFMDAMWLHLRMDRTAADLWGLDWPLSYNCDGVVEWFDYFLPIKIIEQLKAKAHKDDFLLGIPRKSLK
jgi:hypothetical protein